MRSSCGCVRPRTKFARDVMGAVIENRDVGSFLDRAGRAERVPSRVVAEDDDGARSVR